MAVWSSSNGFGISATTGSVIAGRCRVLYCNISSLTVSPYILQYDALNEVNVRFYIVSFGSLVRWPFGKRKAAVECELG